jgi:hypothetical protein
VRRTVAELRKEMLEDGLGQPAKRDYSWRNRKREAKPHRVVGRACDVSDSADVRQLAAFAQKSFGHVDLWVRVQLLFVAVKAHGVISWFVLRKVILTYLGLLHIKQFGFLFVGHFFGSFSFFFSWLLCRPFLLRSFISLIWL